MGQQGSWCSSSNDQNRSEEYCIIIKALTAMLIDPNDLTDPYYTEPRQ